MAAIFENPLPIVFVGIVVESILIALLYCTRKKLWLVPIVGVLAALIAAVSIERAVVTPREEVEYTIDKIAAALRDNDTEAVLEHLSETARESRSRAKWALGRVEVNKVSVSGLDITINRLTSPPTAKATFSGLVRFEDRKKEYPYQAYASKFEVEFRKEGGGWKVTSHSESNHAGP